MEKIKQIIEKVKCTIHKICDTIKNIKTEYDFYKGLWDKPQGKSAVKHVFREVWYLLKKIKPKKIEGDVIFGTGDPAITGQAIGAVAALYGFMPEKLTIVPDFEEKRYEGDLHIKGKLRLIHVVIIGIRLLIDKNVRYVIKKIMTREGTNNEQQ